MASTVVLITKLCSMMLEAAAGFLIVRLKFFKSTDARLLSNLVVYIFTPCLIIDCFQIEITPERAHGFAAALIFSTLYFLVGIPLVTGLQKLFHFDSIDAATIMYPNVGNLILPLVSMVLGDELVFYAAAIQIPFNVFVWTHGESIITGQKTVNLRKILTNSNLIALAVGLLFMLTRFHLPDVIGTAVGGFSDMVGPLSMLVIGMQIADSSVTEALRFKKAYPVIAGRLLVLPAMMLLLLFFSRFLRQNQDLIPVLQVSFMAIAAPPAATVSQLAIVADNQPLKASIYNMMGIIFCIATIPFIIWLYGAVFA